MEGSALQDTLESERRLGLSFETRGNQGGCLLKEFGHFLAKYFDLRATGLEHFNGGSIVQHGEEEMLH